MSKVAWIAALLCLCRVALAQERVVAEPDSNQARGETQTNDPDLFNERGFAKSESYRRITESEQVSNFNGNLTYRQVLFSRDVAGDLDAELSLIYNGSAPHVRFDVNSANGDQFPYNVNTVSIPTWFIGLNGFMVFPIHFNLRIFNTHGHNEQHAFPNSNRANLPVGYAISDYGYMYHATIGGRDDNLVLALEDGTPLELRRVNGTDTGREWYVSGDPSEYSRAFRHTNGQCGDSPLIYQTSDGSIYSFDDICLATDARLVPYQKNGWLGPAFHYGPLALRLNTIRDRGRAQIGVTYEYWDLAGEPLMTRHPQLCPKQVDITLPAQSNYRIRMSPLPDANWLLPFEIFVELIGTEGTPQWKLDIDPVVVQTQLNPPVWEAVQWKVVRATDPEGRVWTFDYEPDDERTFRYGDGCQYTYTVQADRVTGINYPTGGKTTYSYADCGYCEPPEPRCTNQGTDDTAEFQDGSWRNSGRSVFYTNMVDEVKSFGDVSDVMPERTILYSYDWSDDDGGVIPTAPFEQWRINDARYRYETTVETRNGPIPLGSDIYVLSSTYLYRKLPYNNNVSGLGRAQWLTRLVRRVDRKSQGHDQVTRFEYDAAPIIPGGAWAGSFKQNFREFGYGDNPEALLASYSESWEYDSENLTLKEHVDPLGALTSLEHYGFEGPWLVDPDEDPDPSSWFLIEFPTRRTVSKDGDVLEEITWNRTNMDPPLSAPVRAGAVVVTEEVRKSPTAVAIRSFVYGHNEAPLYPTMISGPGSQVEEREYNPIKLGEDDYLLGDGIIPTEIRRRRNSGPPLVTRWGLNGEYGAVGRRFDENGHQRSYDFDNLGRLEEVRDGTENVLLSYSYDDEAPMSVTRAEFVTAGPEGRVVTGVELDGRDRVAVTTRGVDSPRRYETRYVLDQWLEEAEDPEGRVVHYEYDDLGRVIEERFPDGSRITRTYEAWNSIVGYGLDYRFDDPGYAVAEIVENEDTPSERMVLVRDAKGQLRAVGQLGTGSSALSAAYYDYDPVGRLVALVDPIGLATTYAYDLGGRLVEVIHPDERSQKGELVTAAHMPGGPTVVIDYEIFVPRESMGSYAYTIQSSFQGMGNPLEPLPRFFIQHLAPPNEILVDEQFGSGSGPLTGLVPGDPYRIQVEATSNGPFVTGSASFTGFGGGRRKVYDTSDRLRFERHPRLSDENGTDTWIYHKYDRADREVEVGLLVGVAESTLLQNADDETYPSAGTPFIARAYDTYAGWPGENTLGRLVREYVSNSVSGFTETRLLSYDDKGYLKREDVVFSGVSGVFRIYYVHDWMGRLQRCKASPPVGTSFTFHSYYNPYSELAWVGPHQTPSGRWAVYQYRKSGRVEHVDYGNGAEISAFWSPRDRLTELIMRESIGNALHERYEYTDDGQMTECYRIGEEAFGYEYDELNRLTGVDRGFDGAEVVPDWGVEYDEAGSRRTEFSETGSREYHYQPESHRLIEVTPEGAGRRVSWLYNVDGSVAGREEELVIPGQATAELVRVESFDYGWQDRVTTLSVVAPTGPGQPEAETNVGFDYDGSGREIRRVEGTDVTIYLRDAWGNVRADLDATGGVQTWWVLPGKGGGSELGGGGRDGGRQRTTIAAIDPTTLEPVTYLHSDHIGTVRRITDAEGHLVSRLDTLPFGEKVRAERTQSSDASAAEQVALDRAVERGFAGNHGESAAEIQRFEARWYDAEAGRFLSLDPVWKEQTPPLQLLTNPQWLHTYAYAGADPLGTTDPDGKILDTLWDLGSLTYSAITFVNDPSWINAGWVAADVVSLAVPILPAGGGLRAGAKGAKAAGQAADAARGANTAFDIAKAGGKHAGTLKNYAGRSAAEIQKAVGSYERQVALHQQKIANPAQFAERWGQMGAREQAGLLNKWGADAARNQELADVLRGLLGSR